MYIKYPHSLRQNCKRIAAAAAFVTCSFFLGFSSAGQVAPAQLIEAGGAPATGDMDENGVVDVADVTVILEITQGYRQASAAHLRADPNGDGQISVDDALRLLSRIALL